MAKRASKRELIAPRGDKRYVRRDPQGRITIPSRRTDGAKGPPTNLTSPEFRSRYETRFRYWGSRIGATFGEPFLARRVVPVDDPVEAFRKRGNLVL